MKGFFIVLLCLALGPITAFTLGWFPPDNFLGVGDPMFFAMGGILTAVISIITMVMCWFIDAPTNPWFRLVRAATCLFSAVGCFNINGHYYDGQETALFIFMCTESVLLSQLYVDLYWLISRPDKRPPELKPM